MKKISNLNIDNSTNEYLYNGKELQNEGNLNYGWRQLIKTFQKKHKK